MYNKIPSSTLRSFYDGNVINSNECVLLGADCEELWHSEPKYKEVLKANCLIGYGAPPTWGEYYFTDRSIYSHDAFEDHYWDYIDSDKVDAHGAAKLEAIRIMLSDRVQVFDKYFVLIVRSIVVSGLSKDNASDRFIQDPRVYPKMQVFVIAHKTALSRGGKSVRKLGHQTIHHDSNARKFAKEYEALNMGMSEPEHFAVMVQSNNFDSNRFAFVPANMTYDGLIYRSQWDKETGKWERMAMSVSNTRYMHLAIRNGDTSNMRHIEGTSYIRGDMVQLDDKVYQVEGIYISFNGQCYLRLSDPATGATRYVHEAQVRLARTLWDRIFPSVEDGLLEGEFVIATRQIGEIANDRMYMLAEDVSAEQTTVKVILSKGGEGRRYYRHHFRTVSNEEFGQRLELSKHEELWDCD